MMAAICELSSYYVINPWWYILAAVPHSLLGGNCVFSVAAFCFISDITDCKSRPYRMIFMESLFFIGLTSGSLLSSFVYAAAGSAATIGLSGCIVTFATIFIIFFVPESLHFRQALEAKNAALANGGKDGKEKDVPITACDLQLDRVAIDCPPTFMGDDQPQKPSPLEKNRAVSCELPTPATPAMSFDEDLLAKYVERLPQKAEEKQRKQAEERVEKAGLFSTVHIKDMISTCFKPREHNARAIIWLVTLAMFLSIFVFGEWLQHDCLIILSILFEHHIRWRDDRHVFVCSRKIPLDRAGLHFLRDSQPSGAHDRSPNWVPHPPQGESFAELEEVLQSLYISIIIRFSDCR